MSGEGAVSTALGCNAQPDSSTSDRTKRQDAGDILESCVFPREYLNQVTNGSVRSPSSRADFRLLLCLRKEPHVENFICASYIRRFQSEILFF